MAGATTASLGRNCHTGLQQEIEELLRNFRGVHPARKLFWELLGYDRRDELVSLATLSSDVRSSVMEARLLASHDKFHIYYIALLSESLTRPVLRRLYRSFRRKHHFI